jgi:hypothetical protein
MVLESSTLTSNDHAFSNALYVHPTDFSKLVDMARADPEAVKEKGILCAVGEGVFFVRQAATYKPGTIGVGMHQRLAGQILQQKPTPVTPFQPPRGNFPMASIQLEVDFIQKSDAEVSEDQIKVFS